MVEQQVSDEEEFDEFEDESYHYVALDEDDEPVGFARWRHTDTGIKLERFTAKKSMRGKGLGSALLEVVLNDRTEKAEKSQKACHSHAWKKSARYLKLVLETYWIVKNQAFTSTTRIPKANTPTAIS